MRVPASAVSKPLAATSRHRQRPPPEHRCLWDPAWRSRSSPRRQFAEPQESVERTQRTGAVRREVVDGGPRSRLSSRASSIERRNLAQRYQNFDRPRPPRCSLNQATTFEGDDHVVHGRWRHLEVALTISFGWRTPVQFGVGHDERQVLTLQLREFVIRQLFRPVVSAV